MIVQVSVGGAVGMTVQERVGPVSLKPEMATLTCGTCNFGDDIFTNSIPDIEFFAKAMKEHGVMPEFEIFEAGMIETAKNLAKKGLVELPGHFDFVMGVPGAIPGDPRSLMHLVNAAVPLTWRDRRHELSGHHGHRLGDTWASKITSTTQGVKAVQRRPGARWRLVEELGRKVATPDEARRSSGCRGSSSPYDGTGGDTERIYLVHT